jgi:glycine/D-amino acid oxidase-like deaminating enzyme
MKTLCETQVIVIGAGAVGCSIAFHLALRGIAVCVVEEKAIGSGASTATFGLTWVQEKEPANYMELNMLGVLLHEQMAAVYDEDVGFRMPGGIIICLTESELENSTEIFKKLHETSRKYQARMLTPSEVKELEPCVSPNIAGGFYSPHDGHINPIKLVTNLKRLAVKHGATFLENTPVLTINRNERGMIGVDTLEGRILAKSVVVASGTGTMGLVKPLGIHLPIKFDRGQILVTSRIMPILNHPKDGVRQTIEGNILMGTVHEDVGLDSSTTIEAAKKIADHAIRTFPILRDIPIIRQFSGIRTMPVDGLPFMGPVEKVPGLFISVSHSGITLAIVHGKVISELIVDGYTNVPIDCYKPERYTQKSNGDLHRE